MWLNYVSCRWPSMLRKVIFVLLRSHFNSAALSLKHCFTKESCITRPAFLTFMYDFTLLLYPPPPLWVYDFQTVELSDCERTQALALRVLLSLSKFNQHRIHEMDCYHGYSMIHQVLIKSKCIVGYHMLKVSHTSNSLVPTASADLLSETLLWIFLFSFILFLLWNGSILPHQSFCARVGSPPVTWPSDRMCN